MNAAFVIWLGQIREQSGMSTKLNLLLFNSAVAAVGQYGNPLAMTRISVDDVLGRKDRDVVVRMALRAVTGLPKSTPVHGLFGLTGQ